MKLIAIATFLLAALTAAAAEGGPQHPSPVDGPGVRTSSGLVYWDLEVGSGPAAVKGDKVRVHYSGWLLEEGTKFDSSYDHGQQGQPFEFTIGAKQVIQGWDEGVTGMKVGGKRQLRIPPELGYGFRGQPPSIPKNAYLLFDVELLDVTKSK